MFDSRLFVVVFVFCVSLSVFASVETSTSAKTPKMERQTGSTQDLDIEVTDNKLRASSGAKSRYSSSFYLVYSGGSFSDPVGENRPNVRDDKIQNPVSLSGNVGLRYRIDKNRSLFAATGFYQARPFHSREPDQELEVSTPQLMFNRTFAFDQWQISSSYQLYLVTQALMREFGQVATLGYSLSTVNQLGGTHFHGRLSLNLWGTVYDKHDKSLRALQEDYGLSLSPTLQYNYRARYNFYTSLSLFSYSHVRSESDFNFEKRPITQTVGAGIAVFRDGEIVNHNVDEMYFTVRAESISGFIHCDQFNYTVEWDEDNGRLLVKNFSRDNNRVCPRFPQRNDPFVFESIMDFERLDDGNTLRLSDIQKDFIVTFTLKP